MVDITSRQELLSSLGKLSQKTKAQFGILTPHHMIEHLAFAIKFSNGKLPQKLHVSPERAQAVKQFILGEGEHPIGFKSPVLGEGLELLLTPNLEEAIRYLENELIDFHQFFAKNPDNTPMSPVSGELSYPEWIRYHNKHFTHHFRQFNIE